MRFKLSLTCNLETVSEFSVAISPIPLPFGLGINEVNLFVFDLVSPLLENRLGQLSIAHGTKVP